MFQLFKRFIKFSLNYLRRILLFFKNNTLPKPENLEVKINNFVDQKKTNPPYLLYQNEQIIECYNHFKDYFKTSVFLNSITIREYAIKNAVINDQVLDKSYLEFGVYKGDSVNFFSTFVEKIYGFDSFQGLNEDWVANADHPKGTFSLVQQPQVNKNVELVIGKIQNTLSLFISKKKPEINFIHIDTDTYETATYILKETKPYLVNNSIIIFDNLYNYMGWREGEYKALVENFEHNEYKFLAFAKDSTQAVIKIFKK